MPQAVDTYIETNNLNIVDQVKRNILELYEDDFRKIDSSGRAGMLFDAIPAELNKNASRYQVSSVIAGEKEERVREILADMQDSMTVYISYHADDPGAGMSLHKDPRRYKLFLCDTGLFATLAFKDRDFTENEIYEKLLNHKLGTDLGYLYENMVAQMLKTAGNELFYYTFPKETSNHNYEIDFLMARKNKICPLEVKSSGYKSHASLDAFQNKFSSRILNRYLIYTKDVRKDKDIFCLPIYMVPFL
jgi:predicted AAA+ superfamily ATPase